ncbi:MAG: hypothetical protein WCK35_19825 [Chloroflexota bacterium]
MKIGLKILSASGASFLFLIAVGYFLSGVRILETKDSTLETLISLLFALLACFALAWVNTRSLWRSIGGALGGLLLGFPIGYLLLAPLASNLTEFLFPLSNLGLSGSLGGAWLLLSIVITLEVLTDRVITNYRWLMLLIGVTVVVIIVYVIELISATFGLTSSQAVVKFSVYTPLIWGLIVGATNLRSSKHMQKGEKDGHAK